MKTPKGGKAAPTPKQPSSHEHKPTDASRAMVRKLAGMFLTQDQICLIVGIGSKHTLAKHYRAELDVGMAEADMKVGTAVVTHLEGRRAEYDDEGRQVTAEILPDRSMAIWLSKARLGMREVREYRQTLVDAYDVSKLSTEELRTLEGILSKAEKKPQEEVANDDAHGNDTPRVKRAGTRGSHKRRTRRA